MNNKKEKVGLNIKELILSMLGIIILLLFIILPPTFRILLPKEEPEEEVEPVVVIKTLTCTVNNKAVTDHIENEIIQFKYYINQIRSYTKTKEEIYQLLDEYELRKEEVGKLSTAYSLVEGTRFNVSTDDTNLKINIQEYYDLGLFHATDVLIPGEASQTRIEANYSLTDIITDVKDNLTTLGYNCVDTSN